MGNLDNVVIENLNCDKALQPIIFNWQPDPMNRMKNITLDNVTIHNLATKPGGNVTPMSGGYPDTNKNGEPNAYGIWARGVSGLKLKCCKFYDDGESKRAKFMFDNTVENVDKSEIDDCPEKPKPQ